MSIFGNGSTHTSNKPERQQKCLNTSISFIPGPFRGYQHPGGLLVRVLSWSLFSERGAGEPSAGNTRTCSGVNRTAAEMGEDTGCKLLSALPKSSDDTREDDDDTRISAITAT